MSEELRIGMIGAGWVTDHHLPAWAEMAPRARVVAICDPDRARADAQARAHGIPAVHDGAEAMLAAGGLDAVDICAPREAHAGLVRLAVAHGLPVLCQKPLATDLSEALALAQDIAGGPPVMVHENWRFRRYYRVIRDWIDEGAIGDIRHARMDIQSRGMIPDERGVRPALERQPMLAGLERLLLMEIMIHHLDTLRFLLGEMEVALARLDRTNDAIRGEDVATLAMKRAAGGTVFVDGNLAVHGAEPVPVDRLSLFGSRGTLRLDGDRLTLDGPEPRAESFDLAACYRDSYAAAIGHFLDGLERGGRFETSVADNLRTLELVERGYEIGGFSPVSPA